ncbi:MAG: ATP-binding protein [Paenibacillus macerans]|uniref:AlbA family DNA-binding domain-containing protein n=1 Tax=Paenibacillus macerans TaxID=44252 RepID=UPI00242A4E6D|nr:ATP-binding protein [Paenibacillus macerans]MBS5913111.1 ATP-binding protein [Paenibacillus macerans]
MELLDIIRYENESTYVDFKKTQYQDNESFLKDIMAMANANTDINKRYIIIGVKHMPNGDRNFFCIPKDEFKDDADYQDLVRQNIEPEIKFVYKAVEFEGHLLGVFEITNCEQRPYVMKKAKGKLEQGACYIRRGSQQGRVIREDLEIMYEKRFKKQRERDIKNSYIYLLKQEFENNRALLHHMARFSTGGPIIAELWSPAAEIANRFIFEAWDSIMRSGIIASLEFNEMQTYRQAVKAIREAVFYVRKAHSNWIRALTWDKPLYVSSAESSELKQPISPNAILQQDVRECGKAINDAIEASKRAIELLESNRGDIM